MTPLPADLDPAIRTAVAAHERAHPKPLVGLPFPTPIVFFRRPDDGAIGPTEIAPLMVEAGVKAVAIDPLASDQWGPFLGVMRTHDLNVYTWTRITDRDTAWRFADASQPFVPDFANIEDDDLRDAATQPGGISGFLSYVREVCQPVGVLTNAWVNELWSGMPLTELPCLPEIFPREVPAAADVTGCLARAQSLFRTALPLFDGREDRGLAAFNWTPGPRFGVWVGDDVRDWTKWRST